MTIGDLAAAAGVGIDTVRYYERRGLLPAPPRTMSGYRQYGDADVARLQQVLRAKALGFTLREIRELADDADGILAAARAKRAAVAAQQAELTIVTARLDRLVGACEEGTDDCLTLGV
jgi:MerR family transcriptional regulator, copper efflux regulator